MKLKIKANIKDRVGRCYELCLKYIFDHPEDKDIQLVHGFASDPSGVNTINHSWLEWNDKVYDPVMDREFVPKIIFYRLFHAEAERTYSAKETLKLALKHKTYGPWHDIDMSRVSIPSTRNQ